MDNGQLGVPANFEDVGYFSPADILPGAVGNVIMDGHVDSREGPAVFFPLKKLKRGDSVILKSNEGEKIEFILESVKLYKTDEAPIQKIFGPTNEARLNLITCGGKYIRQKKEYEARLVVYTKRAK